MRSGGQSEGRSELGAGDALGLLVALAVAAGLGFGAWRAFVDEAPARWVLAGAAAVVVVGHLVAGRSTSLLTRGVGSAAFAAAVIAALIGWLGPERAGGEAVAGISLADVARFALIIAAVLGAGALALFPSAWPARIILALVGLALAYPWLEAARGASVLAVLGGGDGLLPSAPWYFQPALIGLGVLLVALLAGAISLAAVHDRPDRGRLAVAAIAVPLCIGLVLAAYELELADARRPAVPRVVADRAETEPEPAADAGPIAKPTPPPVSSWSALPGRDRYDCSGVISPEREVATIRDAYDPRKWRASAIALLEARYPGAAIMVATLGDRNHFDVWFRERTETWDQLIMQLSTGVHEAAHMAGLQKMRGNRHPYVIDGDETITMRRPTSFDRSEIAARLPPEIRALSYTSTYLDGKSGAQGFEMVLEELNAYTWSMFTSIAVASEMPRAMSTSARDGLLTLMYYLESYLALARTERDEVYARIRDHKGRRDAILLLWDRAVCALTLSADNPQLGIDDDMLRRHVFGDARLGEVDRLRAPD